jgi:prevent-host-death family protein
MIFIRFLFRTLRRPFIKTLTAANILPLASFKAHASEIINGMKEDKRPVVITQNGSAAAVLLMPEEYDSLMERAQLLQAVGRGLEDSRAGRLIDHADLAAEVASRYETR